MATQWYILQNGVQKGPVGSDTVRHLAATGELKPHDLLWKPGLNDWIAASHIKGLFPSQSADVAVPPIVCRPLPGDSRRNEVKDHREIVDPPVICSSSIQKEHSTVAVSATGTTIGRNSRRERGRHGSVIVNGGEHVKQRMKMRRRTTAWSASTIGCMSVIVLLGSLFIGGCILVIAFTPPRSYVNERGDGGYEMTLDAIPYPVTRALEGGSRVYELRGFDDSVDATDMDCTTFLILDNDKLSGLVLTEKASAHMAEYLLGKNPPRDSVYVWTWTPVRTIEHGDGTLAWKSTYSLTQSTRYAWILVYDYHVLKKDKNHGHIWTFESRVNIEVIISLEESSSHLEHARVQTGRWSMSGQEYSKWSGAYVDHARRMNQPTQKTVPLSSEGAVYRLSN